MSKFIKIKNKFSDEGHKNIYGGFKKAQKFYLIPLFISFLMVGAFYYYADNNRKFEVGLDIKVKKYIYDDYNLDKDAFIQEINKLSRDIMLADTSRAKIDHKLKFGIIVSDSDNRLSSMTFSNVVYGINLDKKKIEELFEKLLFQIDKDYKRTVLKKLESIKVADEFHVKEFMEKFNSLYNDINNPRINFEYELNPYMVSTDNIMKTRGLEMIILDENHFSYTYYMISKQPSLVIISIFVFIFSYLSSIILIGLYFTGKKFIT